MTSPLENYGIWEYLSDLPSGRKGQGFILPLCRDSFKLPPNVPELETYDMCPLVYAILCDGSRMASDILFGRKCSQLRLSPLRNYATTRVLKVNDDD